MQGVAVWLVDCALLQEFDARMTSVSVFDTGQRVRDACFDIRTLWR